MSTMHIYQPSLIAKRGPRRIAAVIQAACLAGAVIVGLLAPGLARAARPGLPARYYPAGVHLHYDANLSNSELDCAWGFYCEVGIPLYHLHAQDALHRIDGWAQYAAWRGLHAHMEFALFASRYEDGTDANGTPWSLDALNDLRATMRAYGGYRAMRHAFPFADAGASGDSLAVVQDAGDVDIVVVAHRVDQFETEAIAVFSHGASSIRRAALTFLGRQVGQAVSASA
jgi:hypothetical protein